jgi:hypothetical protein
VSAQSQATFRVGQNDGDATKNYYPNYYQAAVFEKGLVVFYDNVIDI